ncbi:peptidoglycan DD-metalloendopeptidase family protein [Streptomyces sp. NPDC048644]|uniref:peptidoglycan DD-metalloendopeptidase family protein n=1 Tax=Streptomyces sp. NPDC048644 TaxID=3365582 RepID=UPI0037228DD0
MRVRAVGECGWPRCGRSRRGWHGWRSVRDRLARDTPWGRRPVPGCAPACEEAGQGRCRRERDGRTGNRRTGNRCTGSGHGQWPHPLGTPPRRRATPPRARSCFFPRTTAAAPWTVALSALLCILPAADAMAGPPPPPAASVTETEAEAEAATGAEGTGTQRARPRPPLHSRPPTPGDRSWPVDGQHGLHPTVLRGWEPPPSPWSAGHRGVDLAAPAGATVRAAAAGRVTFAGQVAGRGVLTIELSDSGRPPLRTTYEPVRATARKGDEVTAGHPVAVLQPGPFHCREPCLHWGLLRGKTYLDPLSLLPPSMLHGGPSRLLPVFGVPIPPPSHSAAVAPSSSPHTSRTASTAPTTTGLSLAVTLALATLWAISRLPHSRRTPKHHGRPNSPAAPRHRRTPHRYMPSLPHTAPAGRAPTAAPRVTGERPSPLRDEIPTTTNRTRRA